MLSGDGSCTADSIWRFSWRMLMTALVYEAMREGCSCAKRCFSPSISLHRRQIQSPTSSHSQLMYDRGTMQWLWLNSAHISHFRGSDKSNCLHIEQNMMDIVDIRWCLFSVCYCARPLCRFVFCSAYVKCHASCSSVLMEIHSSSSSSYFCMFIYVILVVVGFSCRRWPIRVDICIYCYSLGVMSRAMMFHCLLSGVIFHVEQFKSFNSIYFRTAHASDATEWLNDIDDDVSRLWRIQFAHCGEALLDWHSSTVCGPPQNLHIGEYVQCTSYMFFLCVHISNMNCIAKCRHIRWDVFGRQSCTHLMLHLSFWTLVGATDAWH